MISGKLANIDALIPYVSGPLAKALAMLKDIDFTSYADGTYPLSGDDIKAGVNTYLTEPADQRRWEKHDKYIDIQIIGKGSETIGYCDYAPTQTITENRLAKDDVAFYENIVKSNSVTLFSGEFAILFPWELHKPNCQTGSEPCSVQKIVIKVKKA